MTCIGRLLTTLVTLAAAATTVTASDHILTGKRVVTPPAGENQVIYRCLTGELGLPINPPAAQGRPGALSAARDPNAVDTIRCLVLRYNFQLESPDNPNTTGDGHMDMRPLTDEQMLALYGHFMDKPPHDSAYFDAHMRALARYYETVSNGKLVITWDVYPPGRDSVYQLPHPMGYYGYCEFRPDSIIAGLERYFVDAIHLADSAHIIDPGHPDIQMSNYDAYFLFHAGSDRQNDIGFPTTCQDMFTGFIRFFDSLAVDDGSHYIRTALLMPETAIQDNRVTVLNAVIAHEFGHQLGLPDMYATSSFLSQLGDFSLMDNNGFGTGIDYGFPAGRVFGGLPVYPDPWCRAYLGYDTVVNFRQGDDIRVVAAAVQSQSLKIARIPITETEYYLVENRLDEIDGDSAAVRLDPTTNVILWPTDRSGNFNREYDFLIPGNGLAVYHVDEAVAAADYNRDGEDNFHDNQLQVYDRILDRRFISLVEADGLVNLGGYYRSGYGSAADLFRDDRNTRFTPYTNPPAVDNSGNNTHYYLEHVTRDTIGTTGPGKPILADSAISFDLSNDRTAVGFPVRVGRPLVGFSPIVDDLDDDGSPEIIVPADRNLAVFGSDGRGFLNRVDSCASCPPFLDSVHSDVFRWSGENPKTPTPVPIFVRLPNPITAAPVTIGLGAERHIVVGIPANDTAGFTLVYANQDANNDGMADATDTITTPRWPLALSAADSAIWILTYSLDVHRYDFRTDSLHAFPRTLSYNSLQAPLGIAQLGNQLVVQVADSAEDQTRWWLYTPSGTNQSLDFAGLSGIYQFGPLIVDVNRDGEPELAAFSSAGDGIMFTVDGSVARVLAEVHTGNTFTTNPTAGDIDLDGYPDILIGGIGKMYAFNRELTMLSDFPRLINDRFPTDPVIASPIIAGIESGGLPEFAFPTEVGNMYAFGEARASGFPLTSGEQTQGSSSSVPVVIRDNDRNLLGYLGGDGWFYAWDISSDSTHDDWPMNGGGPAGSFHFDNTKLPVPATYSDKLPEARFYNYPNPVIDGVTTWRYFLGAPATRVTLTLYDMAGNKLTSLEGPTSGGVDNEVTWNCSSVTPGVYRCRLEAEFAGETRTVSKDVAIIK